jgi:hypothetical protein
MRVLSAGSAPLSSAAARAAQPASVIWVLLRWRTLSFQLCQHSCRRRQRTCRQRRRHEGGEALVAEPVANEAKLLQRGPPPPGRREGHQPRVTDGGVVQREDIEPRHGASAQGGGERRGACVAHMHADDVEIVHRRQRARALGPSTSRSKPSGLAAPE